MTHSSDFPRSTPPGEGERRAQRGYQQQYDVSASLIYTALLRNELVWIGLADRGAGVLDDLVLGLTGRVVGHQIKSSQFPEPFGVRSVLLGPNGILPRLANAWGLLRKQFTGTEIEIRFITADYPSTNDRLVLDGGGPTHSAAFVAEFALPDETEPAPVFTA